MSVEHPSPLAYPEPVPLQRRWWHEIPMWLFYVPIGLAVMAMSLRHLSPLVALKANPGLTKGGLFPASKQDFFDLFPADSPLVPVSLKLDATLDEVAVAAAFDRFVQRLGHHPIRFVVKPDDGIQGQDIRFFETADELAVFWQSEMRGNGDWLLQEFIDGLEVALFYNQPDSDSPGRILSMTFKHGFEVTGDGHSCIDDLIETAKADTATKKRVRKNMHRLAGEVPLPGQVVELMPVRNHHLGATFQDATDFITPELAAALCAHLDPVGGFQYGRLDCRVSNFEQLKRGEGIKALEVNALYSEPVHAYDPKYGLRDAYRIFIGHWREAIRTGLSNSRKATS